MNDQTTEPRAGTATVAHIDFERDLANIFAGQLAAAGYGPPTPPAADACDSDHHRYRDDILYKWLHLCNRIPPPRPRRVHKSSEFRVSSVSLAPELQKGLSLIEHKLAHGHTVHHHLSRRIGELNYHDLLLDDWDIHHLHLGTTVIDRGKSKGLIEGTREVVYCIFKPDDVYLIQVMSHEFYDPVLLEIINSNWPELLSRLPLYPPVTPEGGIANSTRDSVKAARAPRVPRGHPPYSSRSPLDDCPPLMVPVTLRDGTVLMPPGLGFATSGHSLSTRMAVIKWKRKLQQWEMYLREILQRIVECAQERGVAVPPRITFVLRYDESSAKWVADSAELRTTAHLEP
jgi:hypothetical protein